MSLKTKDILIEVTSTHSLEFCKKVMEELIVEMLRSNLCSKDQDEILQLVSNSVKDLKLDEDDKAEIENLKPKQVMWIQQTKIVDVKGNLKCVYPSRIDLTLGNKIKVERLYDD